MGYLKLNALLLILSLILTQSTAASEAHDRLADRKDAKKDHDQSKHHYKASEHCGTASVAVVTLRIVDQKADNHNQKDQKSSNNNEAESGQNGANDAKNDRDGVGSALSLLLGGVTDLVGGQTVQDDGSDQDQGVDRSAYEVVGFVVSDPTDDSHYSEDDEGDVVAELAGVESSEESKRVEVLDAAAEVDRPPVVVFPRGSLLVWLCSSLLLLGLEALSWGDWGHLSWVEAVAWLFFMHLSVARH